MVTDQELVCCVESLLRQVAPGTTASLSGIVRHLEAKLGLDLSHKAAFIRHHIDLLLSPPLPPPKDHFALNPQFYHHLHHLPHHHDFAFRYPAPQMPVTMEAHQHQHQHQHQYQHKVDQFEDEQKQPQSVPVMPAPKEGASAGVKRRGRPGGLNKVCGVSPELQAIVGEPTMARTQIVKQLWAYIRKNNLQDPKNKRKIICNDELRLVFETDCTDMFKMNKLLCKHIITLESTKDTGRNSKKLKVTAEVISATEHDPGQNPVAISDALAVFFGTGERDMIQSEASRRVWDYIKANQLEDPMNPMVVLCDSKLQQLFGCESLSSLGIQEMLMRHLFKQS